MSTWPLSAGEFRALTEQHSKFDPPDHLKGDLLFLEVERLSNKAYDMIHTPGYTGYANPRRIRLEGQKWYMRRMLCKSLGAPRGQGPYLYNLYFTPDGAGIYLLESSVGDDSAHIWDDPDQYTHITVTTSRYRLEIARKLLIHFHESNTDEPVEE